MQIEQLSVESVRSALNSSTNLTTMAKILKFGRSIENFNILKKFISDNGIEYPPLFGMRKHMTIISQTTKEQLQKIVDNSSSNNEILGAFGLRLAGSNATTLKKILNYHDIDLTSFNNNRKRARLKNLEYMIKVRENHKTYDDVKHSSFSTIRKYIIKNNLLEYKCQIPECGNIGIHCGKPLTLEIDHIDGNRNNNELENLRFICPSCHSQTETFSGKSKVKRIIKFCKCGNKLGKSNLSGICSSCSTKNREFIKKFEISKESLESLVIKHPILKIGEMFGVSDNAIRKRCKKLGIDLKSLSKFSHKIRKS